MPMQEWLSGKKCYLFYHPVTYQTNFVSNKLFMLNFTLQHASLTFYKVIRPGRVTNTICTRTTTMVTVIPLSQAPSLAAIYSEKIFTICNCHEFQLSVRYSLLGARPNVLLSSHNIC